MKSNRPTSVNVISWLFIIIAGLGILSAAGYFFISFKNQLPLTEMWRGFGQLIVSGVIVYCSIGFLKGQPAMRTALEYICYAIALILVISDIKVAFELNTPALLIGPVLYLIPIAFIVQALRSEQVRTFVSTKA